MRFPFRLLPRADGAVPRPVIDVHVEGIERTALGCLVGTGSLHNRFGGWVAREAGIGLDGLAPETIGLGGISTMARTTVVRLRLGDHEWEAPVSFCEPWPWDFNLLGQEGFLRWFRVCIEAANRRLDVTPVGG